jgi:uncharacterized protein YcbK (DUF882 family)
MKRLGPVMLAVLAVVPATGWAQEQRDKVLQGATGDSWPQSVQDQAQSETIRPPTAGDEAAVESPKPRPRAARSRGHRCRSWARPEYRLMVRHWQKMPAIPGPRYRDGFRDLPIVSVNLGERIRVFLFKADGSVDPQAMVEMERIFRDKNSDAVHVLHPRLVKLLYKLADHFKARQITLISGYRAPIEAEGGGNHAKGKAADIMIPGVSLAGLAWEARKLGHVGVGFYPTSGFVHLDVRDGPSYFWVDRSGPGQSSCLARVMAAQGMIADRKWKPEADEPAPVKDRKGNLLGATVVEPVVGPKTGSEWTPAISCDGGVP